MDEFGYLVSISAHILLNDKKTEQFILYFFL